MEVNFDGRIFSGVNYSGVIVVVHDSDGSVITSFSQLISQAYTSNEIETMLSYYGSLLDDVHRCSCFFNQLRYSHVKREGNRVANSLAKYAAHISDLVVWMEDVPSQCFPVIQADLAGFS